MKSIFRSNNSPEPSQKQAAEQDSFFSKNYDHAAATAPTTSPFFQNAAPAIQRLATPDEEKMPSTNAGRMEEDRMIQEKPEIQRMGKPATDPLEEKEKPDGAAPVQLKSDGNAAVASTQLSGKITASTGKGQHLPDKTQAEMGQSIGADFSKVLIHTDSEAVGLNQQLQAQAFTHGQDVYFNAGKFSPESREGKKLLAHELTHVVQQGGNKQSTIQRSANNCAWGEIREWAIMDDKKYAAPTGLGDVKESIYATCSRNRQGTASCACRNSGANATAPGDQAAWRNIQAATGTDLSNGANYICVGNQNCEIVHKCRPYYQPGQAPPSERARAQNLQPVATLTLRGNSIYFYYDPKNGNCPPEPKKENAK